MSDLVERLRGYKQFISSPGVCIEAAAHIETLQAELAEARAKVERAREALDYYAKWHPQPSEGPWGANSTDFGDTARAALKEIEP